MLLAYFQVYDVILEEKEAIGADGNEKQNEQNYTGRKHEFKAWLLSFPHNGPHN